MKFDVSPRLRVLMVCTLAALCLAAIGILVLVYQKSSSIEETTSEIPEVPKPEPLPATIEVADTPEKRVQGLSGRTEVPDDYGMLFIFDVEGRNGFWMKDMQVPIDIIWISTEGTIVHIEHALSPDTYPQIFTPQYPARYVLETRAGYARAHKWDRGTILDLGAYK